MRIKTEHLMVMVLGALAGLFLLGGLRKAGGLPVPERVTTEGSWAIPEPVQPVLVLPDEHLGEIVYSKHRYPDRVGGELTTVMHYGHSALGVPSVKDEQWITAPPSEVTL